MSEQRHGTVRVGTSGWQYDHWKGAFYPEDVAKKRWFEYYVTRFPTVELNATFYRLPKASTVESWRDQAPEGFRYAVKGSRYVTHQKKLNDPEEGVGNVLERLAALEDRIGVWLWQLPPNLGRDTARLERFVKALPSSSSHAVEFRDPSWYEEEVEALLREHGVAWVWLSDGVMPQTAPVTASCVYLRLHGLSSDVEQRYQWDYQRDELEPWAELLRDAARAGRDGWVFFNNDYEANAPRNAETMVELLGDVAHPWP